MACVLLASAARSWAMAMLTGKASRSRCVANEASYRQGLYLKQRQLCIFCSAPTVLIWAHISLEGVLLARPLARNHCRPHQQTGEMVPAHHRSTIAVLNNHSQKLLAHWRTIVGQMAGNWSGSQNRYCWNRASSSPISH